MKTDLQTQSKLLQKKVDEFKNSEVKPPDHWDNVWKLIKVKSKLIRIKYHENNP